MKSGVKHYLLFFYDGFSMRGMLYPESRLRWHMRNHFDKTKPPKTEMNHQKMCPKIYLDAARGGGWKELGRENWLMGHVLGYDRSPRFHASKTDNVTDMQLLSHSSYNLLFYQSLSTMCVCDFAKKYLLAIWMEAILVAAHFLQSWEVLVSI